MPRASRARFNRFYALRVVFIARVFDFIEGQSAGRTFRDRINYIHQLALQNSAVHDLVVCMNGARQATDVASALRPYVKAPLFAVRAVQQQDKETVRVDQRRRPRCFYPCSEIREQGARCCRPNVFRRQYGGEVSAHMARAPISPESRTSEKASDHGKVTEHVPQRRRQCGCAWRFLHLEGFRLDPTELVIKRREVGI